MISQASGYFVNVLTNGLLGTSALAVLETARIMASPMLVVITGVATYFIPTTIRLFARGEIGRFRRRLIGMSAVVATIGVLYATAVVLLGHAISQALGKHADPMLGASRSIASTLDSSAAGSGTILYTARRPVLWNIVSATGSLLSLALLVPAVAITGTFGVPLAQGIGSAVKSGVGLSFAFRSRPPEV
jgi:O-antigen/teichoic acid export membrane protein